MALLSREDLEKIASRIISEHEEVYFPKMQLCYMANPEALAADLGYKVDYKYLSKDGTLLGKTATAGVWTTVYNATDEEELYYLDGITILIDSRLLHNPINVGRKNFTIAHELSHQILTRLYPEFYSVQERTGIHCRTVDAERRVSKDWHEWQADTLAAALLLPKDAIVDAMELFCLGEKMTVLSKKYSENRYNRFCTMAEYLQVSRTALSYRMEQLGLLERNLLVKEAQARKGESL